MLAKISWDILESIMEGDTKVRDILDHVKIFFNFLLAKMASKHADITDIKMLWHLIDREGVKQVFREAIKSFGFKESDEDDIKLLLAVTYKLHVDMEREITDADDSPTDNKSVGKELGDNTINEKSVAVTKKTLGPRCTSSIADDICHTKADELSAPDRVLSLNISEAKDMDYMSLPLDLSDKVSSAVLSWNVEDSLKDVARRMVAIVIYTLNVGREKKDLSIINEN